jgi:hypothetical protein
LQPPTPSASFQNAHTLVEVMMTYLAPALRSASALCGLLGVLTPVAAQSLYIQDLTISAEAGLLLQTPDPLNPSLLWPVVASGDTQTNLQGLLPPTVVTGTAIDPWGMSYAAATQGNSGYFRDRFGVHNDYPSQATQATGSVPLTLDVHANTAMSLTVGAIGGAVPLPLTLTIYGAHLQGSDYYSAGHVEMGMQLQLTAQRDSDPTPTIFWKEKLLLQLNGSGIADWHLEGPFIDDPQGVGGPQITANFGFSIGGFGAGFDLTMDLFQAPLDLGVLNPGEKIRIVYQAQTYAKGELHYAGPGSDLSLDLIDPLSLGQAAVPPIQIAGLALPSPVPEPSTPLLAVLGAMLLAWQHGNRVARLARCGRAGPGHREAASVIEPLPPAR